MACPRCGVKGIEIDAGVWKCWACVAWVKVSARIHCDCPCRTCQDCDGETEDVDPRDAALSRLQALLPVRYGAETWDLDDDHFELQLAVLYRADGTDLTALAVEQGKAVAA